MPIERFIVGPMGNNTYVLHDPASKEAILVDPSMRSEGVLDWIRERDLKLGYVLNTHGHGDHVFNNAHFVKATGAQLFIHRVDAPMLAELATSGRWMGATPDPSPEPDGYLEDGQEIPLGTQRVRVIATPGHTPGSACFVLEDAVMTGDTLFQGSIGRFDFPGGSLRDLVASIKTKLFAVLPTATRVLPGHNELSTIGIEKQSNPFVGDRATIDLTRQME